MEPRATHKMELPKLRIGYSPLRTNDLSRQLSYDASTDITLLFDRRRSILTMVLAFL